MRAQLVDQPAAVRMLPGGEPMRGAARRGGQLQAAVRWPVAAWEPAALRVRAIAGLVRTTTQSLLRGDGWVRSLGAGGRWGLRDG